MSASKRWRELAEEQLAESLGRPVKRCPQCGEIGAHWVPDCLDEHGDVARGYFTCQPAP